jgi:hypothetical protein
VFLENNPVSILFFLLLSSYVSLLCYHICAASSAVLSPSKLHRSVLLCLESYGVKVLREGGWVVVSPLAIYSGQSPPLGVWAHWWKDC